MTTIDAASAYARTRGEDREWLSTAVDLAWRCPPTPRAFNVGALIIDADDRELARGWSRDTDEHVHAEESALARVVPNHPRLPGATIYSSLEPCSIRKSRPASCTRLIIDSGIRRVVFAWREPSLLVEDCQGAELLRAAGIEVVEFPEFAPMVKAANAHLFGEA